MARKTTALELGISVPGFKYTPQAKRAAAVKKLTGEWLSAWGALLPHVTQEIVLEGIDSLRKLGRTERWHASLTRWEELVKESNDLHFAIVQGSMYPMWANAK